MADRSRVEVTARLRGAAKFAAEAKTVARSVDNIGDAATRADAKIAAANQRLLLFRNIVGIIKPAALVTGIGLVAAGIGALGAGAIGLTSALAPLSGLLVAYPGLGLAAAQGFGAWKLAMSGVMAAVGPLNGAMNPKKLGLLSAEGQRLALAFDAMKAPIRAIQSATQRGLFPGLTSSLNMMRPVLGSFQGEMKATGKGLGNIAERFALFTRAARGDLGTILGRNALYMQRMGFAGVELTSALRHVLIAAGPLLGWLTKSAVKWADWLNHAAAAGRESGKLASFFWKTRVVAQQLFRILGNVGGALFGIGKAAGPLGRDMLNAIEKSSAAWERWSKSVTGQRDMRAYFASMKAPLWELGRLAVDLTKGLVSMSRNPQFASLIAQVRTQLLPAFLQLTNTTTAMFGPVLVDTLTKVVQLFASLSGTTGPLTLVAQAVGLMASGMNLLFTAVPGAQQATSVLIAFGLASKFLKLGMMFTGLGKARAGFLALTSALGTAKMAMGAMRAVYIANTGVTNASNLAVLRHAAATKLAAVGARVMAVATGALNLVMAANPVVLVIAALVALGAAFYLAYTKVAWFRNGVNATFDWIKGHWPLLAGIVLGPIGFAIGQLITHFGSVKAAGVDAFNALKDGVGGAVRWMADRLRQFLGFLGRVADKIAGLPGVKQALGAGSAVLGIGGDVASALIPGLATGGVVRTPGATLVGEHGPELLSLERGARVDPLPRLARGLSQRRDQAAPPSIGGALADSESRVTEVTVPVHLDGRVIYEAVGRVAHGRASRR